MRWSFDFEVQDGHAYVHEREEGRPIVTRWGPMPIARVRQFVADRKEELAKEQASEALATWAARDDEKMRRISVASRRGTLRA